MGHSRRVSDRYSRTHSGYGIDELEVKGNHELAERLLAKLGDEHPDIFNLFTIEMNHDVDSLAHLLEEGLAPSFLNECMNSEFGKGIAMGIALSDILNTYLDVANEDEDSTDG